MYKAKIEIGGYKPGQEVPEEKAIAWAEMYKVSPVEKIEETSNDSSEDKSDDKKSDEPEEKKEEVPKKNDAMHDDYLNRNADVVKKAIDGDKLEKDVLESLLKIESENKRRKPILKAIKFKMKSL